MNVAPPRSALLHVSVELALDLLHMLGIVDGVFGQNVHEFEEVALDIFTLFVVGRLDNCVATIALSLGDLIETFLEHFLEDDRAYQGLLFHVFLDKLDQELVDQFLEAAWDLLHVFMLHKGDDLP